MKRTFFGIAAIASLVATSAYAADLAPRMYTKAPPPVAVYDWTGLYVGLNGGYSWGRANTTIAPSVGLFPTVPFAAFGQKVDGGLGGGQIGYNWQLDPKWLIGLEGDIQWTGERSSASQTTVGLPYGAFPNGLPNPLGPDFNAVASQTANLSYDLQ